MSSAESSKNQPLEPQLRRAKRPDGRFDIQSLDQTGLQALIQGLGKERFRALQIYKWLWQRNVSSFEEMTNISKSMRVELENRASINPLEQAQVQESEDGTTKFIWRCHDGQLIESVLIPDENRANGLKPRLTLCVSTQVGCAMACSFCLTGDMGLIRNLSAGEIANQPRMVQQMLGDDRRITNIVLMGMGEPLNNYENMVVALHNMLDEDALNYSHRRITVSTVGLVPAMKRLAEETPVNIAVSLNASTEEQRQQVMPITKKYSMTQLLEACKALPLPKAKRITFEYVMMAGFNDSMDDAKRLVRLMNGIRSKVNLIPYNENPQRDIRRPSDEQVKRFQNHLVKHGVQCSVRVSRGRDISAACGQLGKI